MLLLTEEIALNRRQLQSIVRNPEKSAAAVKLEYVSDKQPGYNRIKRGSNFNYTYNNRPVTNKEELQRIKGLAIPPAWRNVWICKNANGHLQATGFDKKGRKQYRYHPLWNSLRNHTKFYRLYSFGCAIPQIRKRIEIDLSRKGLPPEKVLAAVICLMERTSIRVGNSMYEKLNGSFGITTLKDKHVRIEGPNIRFMFTGKKGIFQNISLKSKKLARIVKACRDIPGQELFQYINEEGEYSCIDSGMVNDYIQSISGSDFSAKDIRTWAGSVQALAAFRKLGPWKNASQIKNMVIQALDVAAAHLGNTRSVCRKYYVHPIIISLFESGKLHPYLNTIDKKCNPWDLCCEEKLLLHILKKESAYVEL